MKRLLAPLFNLLLVACIVGPGLLMMWRLGLSFGDLTGRSKDEEGQTD